MTTYSSVASVFRRSIFSSCCFVSVTYEASSFTSLHATRAGRHRSAVQTADAVLSHQTPRHGQITRGQVMNRTTGRVHLQQTRPSIIIPLSEGTRQQTQLNNTPAASKTPLHYTQTEYSAYHWQRRDRRPTHVSGTFCSLQRIISNHQIQTETKKNAQSFFSVLCQLTRSQR